MKKHSISISLSLRFMLIISAATIFLSLSIIFLLHRFSRSEKNRELLRFTEESCAKIQAFGIENELLDLPYHISYGIFDKETGTETSTNDPFIPLLPLTEKKSRHYFEKDFYIDQNLNIFYFSKEIEYSGKPYIVQLSMDLERDPDLQFFLHLPKIIIFILIPLLLISFFMCFLITRQTIKPVEKMTDSAKRIFHENSSEYLPVSKKNTELDNLAETFNALFKKLKADFQREKDFTGNVSHELKTPIAIILGEAKLIKRWGKNDKKQLEESIDTIIEEGTFMEEITKNLLQLTKLESGIIKPDKKEFSVKALFQKIQNEFSSLYPNQKFYIYANDETFFTDESLLHQIIVSAVSNSIKFSKGNTLIKLIYKENQDEKKIIIEDDGPGFSEEIISHIFERFYRGDDAHQRSAGGCGLGLSIAKAVSTVLNLSLTAENALGKQNEILGARIIISQNKKL